MIFRPRYFWCLLLLVSAARAASVPIDPASLELHGVRAAAGNHKGSAAIHLTEGGAGPAESIAVVSKTTFHNGTIEVDVSGAPAANAPEGARGFIGIAFRIDSGAKHFETFYVRPTNARAADQLRRNHTVQYISVPDWPWERLRKETPGVYESYADMAVGEWTHLRIVVKGLDASLYVGGAAQPALVVHDLKLGDASGSVGLWLGPGTDGYFRNLTISTDGEKPPPYGANAAAGHYVTTPDARIYYERYGEGGQPLVLLHGGEYGYIDEFADLIREMSKTHVVIAIATRGYGRSERGSVPLSHRQFALDAAAVVKAVFPNGDKVDVLGFSEGAVTSYILASAHPEMINRLIAISGSLGQYGENLQSLEGPPLTAELMEQQVPGLVAARKQVMEHPEQFGPLIRELDRMYREPIFVKQEEVRAIAAPTLIMAGDHDEDNRTDHIVDILHMLPKGQLAIIPGCGHVVLDCKADLVIQIAGAFLDEPVKAAK